MSTQKNVRIQIFTRDEAYWATNGDKVLAKGQFGALQHSTTPAMNQIALGNGVDDWDTLPKLGVSGGLPAHNHDDRYYKTSQTYSSTEVDSLLGNKQDSLAYTPENAANKGAANGYAPLNAQSQIPQAYLPSYVDDILEYPTVGDFPVTGETGKIYVVTSGADINKQFRWSGSSYAQIVGSPGTTDEVTEGATNKYFTALRVLQTILTGLSTSTNSPISSTDDILTALGKIQAQLNSRVVSNAPITSGTKSKVTFDNKGLITGFSDFTVDDITNIETWAKLLLALPAATQNSVIFLDATGAPSIQSLTQFKSNLGVLDTFPIGAGSTNLLANVSYYVSGGVWITSSFSITPASRRVYAGSERTITSALIIIVCSNTAGSQQSTIAIRVNNTTDHVLTTTFTFNAGPNQPNILQITNLNIALTALDYYEIKITTPAGLSPTPTGAYLTGVINYSH